MGDMNVWLKNASFVLLPVLTFLGAPFTFPCLNCGDDDAEVRGAGLDVGKRDTTSALLFRGTNFFPLNGLRGDCTAEFVIGGGFEDGGAEGGCECGVISIL